MTRPQGDDGVAALELGILLSLLLVAAFGALPLYAATRAYQRVSKASAATIRYAAAVTANGVRSPSGTLSRRPSYDQVAQFARDAARDPTLSVVVQVCHGSAPCQTFVAGSPGSGQPLPAVAGDTVRLAVSASVDLRVLGSVANGAARLTGGGPVFPENVTTVTSTAEAREE